jgi:hypothetical protein
MEEMVAVSEKVVTIMKVVVKESIVSENDYGCEREEIAATEETGRLPPPPWRRSHPARSGIIAVIRIVTGRGILVVGSCIIVALRLN